MAVSNVFKLSAARLNSNYWNNTIYDGVRDIWRWEFTPNGIHYSLSYYLHFNKHTVHIFRDRCCYKLTHFTSLTPTVPH